MKSAFKLRSFRLFAVVTFSLAVLCTAAAYSLLQSYHHRQVENRLRAAAHSMFVLLEAANSNPRGVNPDSALHRFGKRSGIRIRFYRGGTMLWASDDVNGSTSETGIQNGDGPAVEVAVMTELPPPFAGADRAVVSLSQDDGEGAIARLALLPVFFWLLVIIPAWFFYYRDTRRMLRRFVKTTDAVLDGRLEERFPQEFGGEADRLARRLNRMLGKLQEDVQQMRTLQTMRSQFLGNVSHELRTPIFALQGFLETLLHRENISPEQRREFLQKAYKTSVRLDSLLNDLINISKIESGEMKMSFRYFDLHGWLRQQCEELRGKLQKYPVTIRFEPDETTAGPVPVLGDADRLAQVIGNLVNNAVKYNRPNGSVYVGYCLDTDAVEIYVRDTGRGIAAEHLPRIFERFYRVDKERSREVGGTGLGLAIVKHIVEAHGATVRVVSEVDRGSEFSFRLKRKAADKS